MNTIYIGCHLSVTKGYEAMGKTMLDFGGNTFAFFTRNPRGGKSKELLPEDAAALRALVDREHFGPLVAHGSYTMNLCAAKSETRENGLDMLEKDLLRMEQLPGNFYNFHPGAHTGQGMEQGIALIAEALNRFLWPEMQTTVLLETMAGKGSEVGGCFEELREIIDRVEQKDKLGVCLDTCHVNDAGYSLARLDDMLAEFDKQIGLSRLKAVHLNDSLNLLGAHKDRHACIGQGTIGLQTLTNVINHPALKHLPFCLETPNDLAGYEKEIKLLRSLAR